MPIVTLIVAAAVNGVIGRSGELPWRLPADLAHFKAVTMGLPIIMGRKTHDSIGRALPGRRNLVVSRGLRDAPAGVEVFASLDSALDACQSEAEVMIIGGATIYELALPLATRIHLTRVNAEIDGDTRFPDLSVDDWREVSRRDRPADEDNAHALSFIVLERY